MLDQPRGAVLALALEPADQMLRPLPDGRARVGPPVPARRQLGPLQQPDVAAPGLEDARLDHALDRNVSGGGEHLGLAVFARGRTDAAGTR